MEEERKNTNSIYIFPELLEEIFLGLPLKSILKFKTVSNQWRSILESKLFVERRRTLQKNRRKILAAYNCNYCRRPSIHPESRFEGDEEIVYLHCDAAQPSMTCDGLVCITEPGWFNVLNPSTGQLRRFPPGPDPVKGTQGNWLLGFGRDKVTGRYKIVRLCFRDFYEFGILDIETGEWSKLRTPPHIMLPGSKSVYVNGSIYWLQISASYIILALDLHKESYYGIHHLPATWVTQETQLANLEDRLAMAMTTKVGPEWILEIWSMDIEEKGWSKNYSWSKTYSISLAHRVVVSWPWQKRWFTPVSVSKQGNLVFYDNHKRLFKYYSGTDETRCLSSNICVISSYVENLVPLPLKPSHTDSKFSTSSCRLFPTRGSWKFKILRRNVSILNVLFTSAYYLSRRLGVT
ncbi:F-box associated interaction domain [Arabidopsis thaliana x Arabidopsis arenosa]|uniref:F-box associated interaction domain n=1 Tax=Arabidopsis thaliana x Arabidopsis arenosa TaxID=1240361 RepID=A0A8T2AC16_9BRAS|nr:F-box associated interaction domain [Arabidopsis thaliana x Arabidopsis arenosa]